MTAAQSLSNAQAHLEAGRLSDAASAAEDAVALFRKSSDLVGLADALRTSLEVKRQLKEFDPASQIARRELAAFAESGNQRGQACMLLTLGEIASDELGAKAGSEACQMISQAVDLFRKNNEIKMEAAALLSLSSIHLVKGAEGRGKVEFDEAHRFAEEAMSRLQGLQDKAGQGKASHALALVCVYRGEITNGIAHAESALQVWRSIGNRKLEAFEQHCLSIWYLANKAFDRALVAAESAEKLFKEFQNEHGEHEGYASAASTHRVQAMLEKGDVSSAMEVADAALQAAREVNDRIAEASAFQMLCSCAQASDNTKEALAHASSALNALNQQLERTDRSRLWEAAVLQKMASLHLAEGESEKAEESASKARDLCRETRDGREEAKAMCFLCDVHIATGRHAEALDLASEARDMFSDEGDIQGEASACLAIAAARNARGEGRKAAAATKTALELFQEIGDERGEADTLLTHGRFAMDRNEFDQAAATADKGRKLTSVLREPTVEFTYILAAAQTTYLNALYNVGQAPDLKKPGAEWDDALQFAQQAYEKAKAIENSKYGKLVISAAHTLAQVLIGRKEYFEAGELLKEGLDICQKEKEEFAHEGAQLLVLLAQLYANTDQKAEAKQSMEQAIGFFTDSKDDASAGWAKDVLEELMGKKKKKVDDSSSSSSSGSSEEEEEEIVEEATDAEAVAVYTGPPVETSRT
jgi:tetratricopeptide (TPR) repeat protein